MASCCPGRSIGTFSLAAICDGEGSITLSQRAEARERCCPRKNPRDRVVRKIRSGNAVPTRFVTDDRRNLVDAPLWG